MSRRERLRSLLDEWGLRSFASDAAYFQWQRDRLSPQDLAALARLADAKQTQGTLEAETAFYDFSAAPHILPILYSQRYDYYLTVGPLIADHIHPAASVLDVGCGVGLLTAFYAHEWPETQFVGVDRSAASIALARAYAEQAGLRNLRFEHLDVEQTAPEGRFDLLIATHALLQAEQERGLPSRTWAAVERAVDSTAQRDFEVRTGIGSKLDRLLSVLTPDARAVLFEKSRQLARRIPFQRALAARGFIPTGDPIPLRYTLVEDVSDDGPLFLLRRVTGKGPEARLTHWSETPESPEEEGLFRCRGRTATAVWEQLPTRIPAWSGTWTDPALGVMAVESGRCMVLFEYLYLTAAGQGRGLLIRLWQEGQSFDSGFRRALEHCRRTGTSLAPLIEETWPGGVPDVPPEETPLYENHTLFAERVWASLPDRRLLGETTVRDSTAVERHVEYGQVGCLAYLYWASTFDERQIVLMSRERTGVLEAYYRELAESIQPMP